MVLVKSYPPPPVDRGEILRYAGCRRPGEEELALLDSCLSELGDSLRFQVCWDTFPLVLEGDDLNLSFARTRSAALGQRLAGCGQVVLFAATVGLGIDRLISRYSRVSPSRALFFQAIGTERVESLCDVFCEEFCGQAAERGEATTPRFSPGYGDLPLSLQTDIFRARDCSRKIGLSLNGSLLMTPSKSVTAMFGVSTGRTARCPEGCASCGKKDCAFRG